MAIAAPSSPSGGFEASFEVISSGTAQFHAEQQLVLLSPPLWDRLASVRSLPASSSRLAISITTSKSRKVGGSSSSAATAASRASRPPLLPALTCWAQRDPEAASEGGFSAKLPSDLVPKLGLARSSRSRQREAPRLLVQRHVPLNLSVAYLAATSESGFELAHGSQEAVLEQLNGRILHQGDLLRLGLGSSVLSLRVVMTEPVLQGCFDADSTQVLMTMDEGALADDAAATANGDVSMSSTSDLATVTSFSERAADDDDDDDDDSDAFSIDESYLAQTVLQDFAGSNGDVLSPALGLAQPSSSHPFNAKIDEKQSRLANKQKRCAVRELEDQSVLLDALADWEKHLADGATEVAIDVDEEDVIILSEKDLAGLGAFNGDWAVAEMESAEKARLVRLFCSSEVGGAASKRSQTAVAWMSPMLRQNLSDQGYSLNRYSGSATLTLRPLGARPPQAGEQRAPVAKTCPVPLPFADNVTIARVASPFSVDRAYQGLFLEALRTYFEGKQRICKEGDIIAVAIEAGKARFVRREGDQAAASDASLEDVHELRLPGSLGPQKTAIVHFKISALASELLAPQKSTASAAARHEEEASLAFRSQAGALGCIVDPNLTKMVQSGVEKCRVADSARWLGVVSDTPARPQAGAEADAIGQPASPLTAEGSAYASILKLLDATLQPNASRFGLHLSVLLKGARGSGKKTVVRWVAQATGVQLIEIDCFDLVSDTDARTEGTLRARFDKAADCAPAILLLRNIDALARKSQALETGQEPAMATVLQKCVEELREATSAAPLASDSEERKARRASSMPVAVFATTSDPDKCPTGVLGCFKHEVAFQAPNEAERLQMLRIALDNVALSPDVDLKNLATQTAALVAADLVNLVSRAKLASVARIRKETHSSQGVVSDRDLILSGMVLTGSDFEQALNKARSSYSESIGAPKIPNVTWDDVGGLASVKSDILDTIQLPLEHPELFSDGLKKRSGILLYGPPGTGKTLLAKAVATSCSLNFFSVKGPELLNMYIGESEANVRRVFQRARDAKPCVIFFDELDSVAPKRGNQGDSGGVMDRIVSQLLAELDGMAGSSEGTDVFVIGATNRPDLLDPALLRPGRFDRMLYLSVSETHAAQLNILQALTRKFKLDADVGDLSVIADQCPFNLTGADFYALCSDAMLKAMTRKASEVDATIAAINATPGTKGHPHPLTPQYYLAEMARPDEIEVRVGRGDFEAALRELVPSVSEHEMAHYREVQAKFSAPKKEAEQATATAERPAEKGKREGENGGTASIQEVVERATSELGYSLKPPQERAAPGNGNEMPTSPSRLPVRKPEGSSSGSSSVIPSVGAGVDGEAHGTTATLSGRTSRLATRQDVPRGVEREGKPGRNGVDDDEPVDGATASATAVAAGEARRKAKGKGKAT